MLPQAGKLVDGTRCVDDGLRNGGSGQGGLCSTGKGDRGLGRLRNTGNGGSDLTTPIATISRGCIGSADGSGSGGTTSIAEFMRGRCR